LHQIEQNAYICPIEVLILANEQVKLAEENVQDREGLTFRSAFNSSAWASVNAFTYS
jgi:hypothetical protein